MPFRASRASAMWALLALWMLVSAFPLLAQDALTKMRAQYASESNPVNKARILAKLGPREMSEIRRLENADDDAGALSTLEQYRDKVHETTEALTNSGIDASRKSRGFKELQISLRVFLRRLDDLLFTLQQDVRASFRAVRSDLENDESALIDALFPVRSRPRPATASSQ